MKITNSLNANGFGINNLLDGVSPQDAATVSQLNSASQDLLSAVSVQTTQAENSATVAQTASDAAQLSAGIYATTIAGLANTIFGKYFSIPSPESSEYLILYQNQAGSAVEVKRYPSIQAVTDILAKFDSVDERSGNVWGIMDSARRLAVALTTDGYLTNKDRNIIAELDALSAAGNIPWSTRSGAVWGVFDALNRLALALSNDGSLINKGRNILAELDAAKNTVTESQGLLPISWSDRSGYSWGVMDALNRLALALDFDGNLISKGRNITQEIDDLKTGATNNKWITPSPNLYTVGDSISDNSYQPYLRLLMPGRDIAIGALPGKKSGQIARLQGGIAPQLSIAGNTIPASGSVMVSVDVPFLNNTYQIAGNLYGVYGVLSAINDVHYFTRAQPGDPVIIDDVTPFIKSSTDYDHEFRTAIIWAGNNDFDSTYRPQVDGNVTRMVEWLKPQDKRFIVIGMAIADYSDRYKGTPYYADTMALHKTWRERWPNNFLDITPIMQRHYDPNNPTDVQNLIDGCTPSSLRKDPIHPNDAGSQVIANAIYSFIASRNW